ncbi:MAG TPA: tetratricopeptide repeat protein [Armatimonadota bacterium]|nr:tetratricopeptide repeat protein [Armatimonadota bacterium]
MSEQPSADRDAGVRLLRAGDVEGAAYFFQQAIEQNPEDGKARGFLGACMARQGQLDAAIVQLQEAARLQPGEAAAQHNLGVILYQNGYLAEAKDALDRALALDPAHAKAQDLRTRIGSVTQQLTQPVFDTPPVFDVPTIVGGAASPTIDAAAPTIVDQPPSFDAAGPTMIGAATAYGAPGAPIPPLPTVTYAPPMLPRYTELARQELPELPLRLNRGLLWGSAYGQAWFLCSLIAVFLVASAASGGLLLLRLLMIIVCSAFFGALLGAVIAAFNSDEDAAGNIGIAFGIIGWVVQLLFIGIGWYSSSIFAWFFVGRFIGRGISDKVREPILVEPT